MSASLKNNKLPASKLAGKSNAKASGPKQSPPRAPQVRDESLKKRHKQAVDLLRSVRKSGKVAQIVSFKEGRQVNPKAATKKPNHDKGIPVQSGKAQSMVAREGAMSAEINSTKMEKRLQEQSPWYVSLRDPIQGAGARIPDAVGINTATLQVVQTATIATNAQGMNGIYVRSPFYAANTGTVTNAPIWGLTTDATNAAIKWGNQTASTGYWAYWANTASLQGIAQSVRIVSGAVFAEFEGSTIADQGEATSFVLPYDTDTAAGLVSYADYQNHYGSSSIPVNKARSRPMASFYFPISFDEFEYTDFIDPNNAVYALVPVTTGNVAASPYWGLGHLFTGLTSTPSVKYTMVFNLEFVPLLNTIDLIGATASPIDAIEEQMVEQWITTDTMTGIVSNKMVDVQPGSQRTDQAQQGMTSENMFGMLGSVLSEIAPIVLAAL